MKTKMLVVLMLVFLGVFCVAIFLLNDDVSATSTYFTEYNAQNGYLRNLRSTWLASHSGTTAETLAQNRWFISGMIFTGNYYTYRGYFFFDTSSIPDSAVIDSVSFNYTVYGVEGAGCRLVYMADTTASTGNRPGVSLDTGDFYLTFYDKKLAETGTITTTGRKNDTLANFSSFINVTGITRFMVMDYAHDYLNSSPAGLDRLEIQDEDLNRLWVVYHVAYIVPSAPVYFEARTQNSSWIQLNWTKGAGADRTDIYGLVGSYPTLTTGTLLYADTGSWFNHTDLNSNTHWYYSCYSFNETGVGSYSTTYLCDHDTTMGVSLGYINMVLNNATGSYTKTYEENYSLYQEDPDSVSEGGAGSNSYDGDWNTFGTINDDDRFIVQYNIPVDAIGAIWNIKTSESNFTFLLNDSMFYYNGIFVECLLDFHDIDDLDYIILGPSDVEYIVHENLSTDGNVYDESITWLYGDAWTVNFTAESQLNIQETLVNCTATNASHWVSPFWDIWFNATGTGNGTGNASGSVIVNVNGRSFTWLFTVGLFGGVSFGMVLWRRKRRNEG